MSDKLDELASEIDDAIRTTEELKDEPGAIKDTKIDKVKNALDRAQDVVHDLEDDED